MKSVSHDIASLFVGLQQPGNLSRDLQGHDDDTNRGVAKLVLDGVLEVQDGGRFLSGADAWHIFFPEEAEPLAANGALARLSIEALRYGQALDMKESLTLSARLYFYNRTPLSPRWMHRFPSPAAVTEHLGVERGGTNSPLLEQFWTRSTESTGWLFWRSRSPRQAGFNSSLMYKLYVSPRCEAIRNVFATTVRILSSLENVPHFKVGDDISGLLRPDKIVAYFATREEAQQAAIALGSATSGTAAHGVPFTAEAGGAGLISWGVDPPSRPFLPEWREDESWRLWICNRLATYLLTARCSALPSVEPWQFALRRLQLDGVDTTSWTADADIWQDVIAPELAVDDSH